MLSQWRYIFGLLLLIFLVVWLAVWFYPEPKLHLIACDVGQGDATLATYGKTQILVDGGPNGKVLSCLSKHMPFWDREIELVILTHPQLDHFGGLIEVFKRYDVKYFLANSLESGSPNYQVLKNEVGGSDSEVVNPTADMVIRLGLIQLVIVHPTREFLVAETTQIAQATTDDVLGTTTTKRDLNEFSIVAILSLREFDALMTGDIQPPITDLITREISEKYARDFEYIKIPHHGSKNGLTVDLLEKINPEIAVISVGRNSYGHPHEETLKMLIDRDIKILRTDEIGDAEVVSDGLEFFIK